MNDHDPVPPPTRPGYDADQAAFDGFLRGYRPLADDLNTATGGSLGTHTTMDGNAFSRVGNEVGLSDAVRNATQRQLNRVNGLAGHTTSMADAVSTTWTNYEVTEDDHAQRVRRAAGDLP